MKKTILAITLLLILTLPGMAKEISPEDALQRALKASPTRIAGVNGHGVPKLAHTALTTNGRPYIYVFNNSSSTGYVVLSADDSTLPLLGYSDSGSFDIDKISPQMKWWLEEYGRQIEYARSKDLPSFNPTRKISRAEEREAINPMLKTQWDQVAPYNAQCPLSGNDRTWTGCVATSMAQVMKYWNYPEKGTGSITYTIESLEKKVTMNFGLKSFDWDNMLNTYLNGQYNQEQADAVAYLMKACGYAVKMQYSMDASGALAMSIGNAFVKYFNYDGNLLYTLREYYSSEEWDKMIYDNLKNVGPVVYGGGSVLGGGHSFVCDGYDGQGLFHFNWGWSGMSDGYFSLDALQPGSLGTGGGTGGGYNFAQDAVFGIQPPTGKPIEERQPFLTQDGELSGKISGSKLSISLINSGEPMWVNYNAQTLYLKFGANFYPQGEENAEPVYHDLSTARFSIQPGYGTGSEALKPSVDLSTLNLPDGTYKVVVGTVEVPKGTTSAPDEGTGFVACKPRYGVANYVILKVENGKYTVSDDLLKPLRINGEILGDLYYGMLLNVKVTVENPSDVERTSGFAPVFCDSEGPVLLGESIFVTIPPKSTITREWTTDLTPFVTYIDPFYGQTLLFTFFNEVDYSFYNDIFAKGIILKENPGNPTIYLSKPVSFTGSYKEGHDLIIPDSRNIRVSSSLTLTKGLFHYPVVLCLGEPYDSQQIMFISTAAQNIYLSTGSPETTSADIDITMSYPAVVPGQQYYLILAYQGASGLSPLYSTPVKFKDTSGINEMAAGSDFSMSFSRADATMEISASDTISAVEVYSLTGQRVKADVVIIGSNATVSLPGNDLFIISVKDINGKTKSFKLK